MFPERIFYLCAKSGVEADEWMKILRWKMVSFVKFNRLTVVEVRAITRICSIIWLIMRLFVVQDNERSVITIGAAVGDGSKSTADPGG